MAAALIAGVCAIAPQSFASGVTLNLGYGNDGNLVVPAGQTWTFGAACGVTTGRLSMPTQIGNKQIIMQSTNGFSAGAGFAGGNGGYSTSYAGSNGISTTTDSKTTAGGGAGNWWSNYGRVGGGGGGGGTIWLQCVNALDMTSTNVLKNGGAGGNAEPGDWNTFGGVGGAGYFRLDYKYGPVPYNVANQINNNVIGAAVPEPASLALLAVSGLALITRRRK